MRPEQMPVPRVRARRARRRDRRVYWRAHPVLFVLLAAARRTPVLRLGRTLLVSGADPLVAALTQLPLDRAAPGTTGGKARELGPGGLLFDQDGQVHRSGRRSVAAELGSAGVDRLRPVWTAVIERRLAPLASGDVVDMVGLATELSGATSCALLCVNADPQLLARAALDVAAAAARTEVPGLRLPTGPRAAALAAASLTSLLPADQADAGLAAMLTIAAVNTTVAAIPRAVAWCADTGSWAAALDDAIRPVLVDELLRVISPTPLVPRVAAGQGNIDGHEVRQGDRLLLVVRHAAAAHSRGPQYADPAPRQLSQLVFGVGPHACPGARLARAQLDDVLRALAPYRPFVVRARADRRSALPGWASLLVRADGTSS